MDQHFLTTAILTMLGLVLIGLAILLAVKCFRSLSWPSVDATILSSSVKEEFDDGIYYPLKITYQYTVDGHTFVGERIKVGGEITDAWAWIAKRKGQKYPVGSVVRAYFSRKDPANAVLEPGFNLSLLAGIIAIGSMLLASAWRVSCYHW